MTSLILGIDPGLSRCGYGVVQARPGGPRAAAIGVITIFFFAGVQRTGVAIGTVVAIGTGPPACLGVSMDLESMGSSDSALSFGGSMPLSFSSIWPACVQS